MTGKRELVSQPQEKFLVESVVAVLYDHKNLKFRKKNVDQALDFSELVNGDFLVHHQHGICRFEKLGKIDNSHGEEEAITLEFADGLMLHVPLQNPIYFLVMWDYKKQAKLAKLGEIMV